MYVVVTYMVQRHRSRGPSSIRLVEDSIFLWISTILTLNRFLLAKDAN